jgi:hypothetical protein
VTGTVCHNPVYRHVKNLEQLNGYSLRLDIIDFCHKPSSRGNLIAAGEF